jgi:protein transport protein SEC23
MSRNHFPPHYAENISEVNLPAELIPQYTTVEYELQTQTCGAPVFLFVVDTCVDEEELNNLRDSLQQTLNLLPEDALVGLITFGTLVQVHELGFSECPKSYVFRGDKEYPMQKVQEMLSIVPTRGGQIASGPGGAAPGRLPAVGRFLLRAADCSFALEQILDDLQRDPWPCKQDERVQRCTGVALSVAIGLLESSVPRQGSRVMLFVSGPATVGQGAIVGRAKTENIRSHNDIQKNQAPLTKPATDFYRTLSDRAIASCIVVDIFACSLDQVGTLETRVLVSRTGGLFVLADSFGQSVFRESFRRVFERVNVNGVPAHLQMGFGGQIEVIHSREFKIAGAVGPCASLKKGGQTVAETEIGVG